MADSPAGSEIERRLAQQIAFIVEIDKLKSVLRRAYLYGEDRRENSAEHSWHVAMMSLVLTEHSDAPVDRERVMKMMLIHDIVEIDAGDVPVYDVAARAAKVEEEARAADRLFGMLPSDQGADLRALFDEYEAQQSHEARFAKSLDRLMPLLHNALSDARTWRELGVAESQVREVNRVIGSASRTLGRFVSETLDRSVEKGLLAADGSAKS